MSRVAVTRDAIAHRADMAERISQALTGVTTVLVQDMVARDSAGTNEAQLLDPTTRGNLHEALLALGDQLTFLAGHIDELGKGREVVS